MTAKSGHAPFYPSGHSATVLRAHQARTAETCAARLLPLLQPTDSLLDIGCGPGTISCGFAAYVSKVVGVEHPSASSVLSQARQAAEAQGVADKVTFAEADALALPFDDNSFDVVYCNQVLQHVPEPVSVLREMRRVARRLVFAREADRGAFVHFPHTPLIQRFDELWTLVARAGGGEPDAARHLRAWALEAGFDEEKVEVAAGAEAPDVAEWSASCASRLRSSGFRDKALELEYTTEEEVEDIALAWETWAKDKDAWFGYLQGELLARP
ncbi:class I SAM-dependent methyltransferase [Rhodotorula paludigena]|uniref:class I SAM-dependent methyltransferase n=1 Tax=Rhodotorula paludigena TaxID=86838 RepID=UPI00318281DE